MVVCVKKFGFRVKDVVFGPGGSIRAKWLYSNKVVVFYEKVDVFGQSSFIREKVVVFE